MLGLLHERLPPLLLGLLPVLRHRPAATANQLVGWCLSAAGITSGLAAVASGMLEGLATIATLPIAAGAAGYRFVKNLKAICDANRLRCEEADGRYEIVRARPAAEASEPPASDGAN